MPGQLKGIFAAALTPLDEHGAPDTPQAVRHCRWLLENGCDGVSVLGTTGEANSLSVAERISLLEGLAEAGVPGEQLMPGTGCCAIADTVALTCRAVTLGAAGVLVLPPFYYKNVHDDGVFAAFAEVIDRVGDADLRVYLYHFPQLSGVPFGAALIERLLKRYPKTIAGMKDSSGDLANMSAMAERFPGFAVFSGSDELFFPLLKRGGAGCITAVCNVASPLAAAVWRAWQAADHARAEAVHEKLSQVRRAIAQYPLTAALKAIMSQHTGEVFWRHTRPPLVPLNDGDRRALMSALRSLDFAPPPPA